MKGLIPLRRMLWMRITQVVYHREKHLVSRHLQVNQIFFSGKHIEDQLWDPPIELDAEHLTAEQSEQVKQMLREESTSLAKDDSGVCIQRLVILSQLRKYMYLSHLICAMKLRITSMT